MRAGVAFAAACVGIVLGRLTPGAPTGLWFALALGASAGVCVLRGRACRVALVLGAALLMAGWTQARIHTRPSASFEALLDEGVGGVVRPTLVRLECRVISAMVAPPEALTPLDPMYISDDVGRGGGGQWVEAEALLVRTGGGDRRVRGRVRMYAPGLRDEHVHAGQRVLVTGWADGVGPDTNPRGYDGRARARQRGFVGRVRTSSPAMIEPLDDGMLGWVWAAPTRWRGALRRRASAALGDGAGGGDGLRLMAALLLGRREPGIGPVLDQFRRLGASHLLAVSGFHLAVLAGMALWLVRLTGERGRLEGVLVGAATLAYMLVLPTRTPIVRSGVMVLGVLVGDAAGRRPDRLATLAWVAICLLVWRPLDLWSIGYQLSVGITGLLIWLGSTRHPWVFGQRVVGAAPGRGVCATAWRVCTHTLATCVLCWMVAAPTILAHTGIASPIAPLASALLLPIVLLDLAVGFVLVVGAAAAPGLGGFGAAILGAMGDATLWAAGVLERVPGASFRLPEVSALWAAAATCWSLWVIGRARLRDRRVWLVAAVVAAWLGGEVSIRRGMSPDAVLRVDTVDVGDGTCHLVRAGRGAILWDAGSLTRRWNEGAIENLWRDRGGRAVTTAVVSHPNLDHYNALPALAGPLGLERVLVGAAMHERLDAGPGLYWRELLEAQGVRIEVIGAGDRLELGRVTIRVLCEGGAGMEANDRSLVARIEAPTDDGGRRVLLTGDIQAPAMGLLEARGVDVRADVLELPHHGSVHAAALDFVARVDPGVVLQSTGARRVFDTRWDPVRGGRVWWTTAVNGACWVEVRRDGSIVTGARIDAGSWDRTGEPGR